MLKFRVIPRDRNVEKIFVKEGFRLSRKPDFLVAYGGDGIFASIASKFDLPILFVRKKGSLGFNAQSSLESLKEDVKRIKKGDYEIKKFLRINFNGRKAFNDVFLLHPTGARPIWYNLSFNNHSERVISSGILFATPQGSTGFNASLGGPVVKKRRIIMTHILPTSSIEKKWKRKVLRWRILKENSMIKLNLEKYQKARINADGRSFGFANKLTIKKCRKDTQIIVLQKEEFIQTIDAVIEKDDKILLIKRSKEPFKGKWAFVGGHIEEGESEEEALKREVKEEVGLKVEKYEEFGHYFEKGRDPRGPTYSVAFAVKAKGKIRKGIEAKEVRWFNFKEIKLKDLAFDHWKILLDYLRWKGKI